MAAMAAEPEQLPAFSGRSSKQQQLRRRPRPPAPPSRPPLAHTPSAGLATTARRALLAARRAAVPHRRPPPPRARRRRRFLPGVCRAAPLLSCHFSRPRRRRRCRRHLATPRRHEAPEHAAPHRVAAVHLFASSRAPPAPSSPTCFSSATHAPSFPGLSPSRRPPPPRRHAVARAPASAAPCALLCRRRPRPWRPPLRASAPPSRRLRAWMNNMVDIAFPYLLQFIREYTSKVDDLVKDKIESQKEEKAKEKEKDLVAQQNMYAQLLPLALPAPPMPGMAVLHLPWVEWVCLRWAELGCLQWVLVQCQHLGCLRWEATKHVSEILHVSKAIRF